MQRGASATARSLTHLHATTDLAMRTRSHLQAELSLHVLGLNDLLLPCCSPIISLPGKAQLVAGSLLEQRGR